MESDENLKFDTFRKCESVDSHQSRPIFSFHGLAKTPILSSTLMLCKQALRECSMIEQKKMKMKHNFFYKLLEIKKIHVNTTSTL